MKIVDYSPSKENYSRRFDQKLTLEVLTAALIFILPALMLFILSQ